MANIRVDVDISRALSRLRNYDNATKNNVKVAVQTSTMAIESGAKRLAPVDTGQLRSSIKGKVSGGGYEGNVTPTVEHAPFVEYGTRKMPAQPYMLPAAEEEAPVFNAAIRRAVME
ncbi:HK97-gp10 family putative phage morphogenesis protein [Exiguobacterium sp. s102]|uniref:HK97-gp10 family putative phage morphogenesis protein n=1 Tax=Exiguobacterium sp. s102 TaxID=2751212 RepID=UPI001BE6B0D1|nr:HK97-gp10 family putative phage morphogenesis protein [Exiguobacterium sp. s102]